MGFVWSKTIRNNIVGFVWTICDQSDGVHKFETETLGQYQGAWCQRRSHIIRG